MFSFFGIFGDRRSSSARAALGRRAVKPSRPRYFRPCLEGFEDRVVPAAPVLSAAQVAPLAQAAPAQATSPLSITGINVTDLVVTGANQLTATLSLVGQVAGQNFTLPGVQVPITISQTGTTQDGCPILHLELQIPDLNVLGLHVQLDDCQNGPVTIDVTAREGQLLGDLLCGLTSNGVLDLNGAGVTGALQQVLNGVLGNLLQSGTPGMGGGNGNGNGHGHGHGGNGHGPHICDLVNLEIDGIHLNVLGLQVDTSAICLDIFAQKGGGILGDLLCNIDHLLSHNNQHGNALTALTNNVLGALNGLNL